MSERTSWVILTQGTRPDEVATAVASLRRSGASSIVIVLNGAPPGAADQLPDGVTIVQTEENLGVPGGRHRGLLATASDFVGFLDDDAVLRTDAVDDRLESLFDGHRDIGAVSFRIEDERGEVARRHVPRAGEADHDRSGPAATFLGGASIVRRAAYDDAGGYWNELFYAHEELDLSWRMHDAGWTVHYAPEIVAEHPRTPISRHGDGWRLTGRNRVMVARRNLPWPVAVAHVGAWLVLGTVRAPGWTCRKAYLAGWASGWRRPVTRRPIGWSTVRQLGRAGRTPVI